MKPPNADPESLPAYAVYKNLIPGVKSYQDNNSSQATKGKKSRKRKLENSPVPVAETPSPDTATQEKKSKKRGKRGKKSKVTNPDLEADVTLVIDEPTETITVTNDCSNAQQSSSSGKKKKNKKKKSKDVDDTAYSAKLVNGNAKPISKEKSKSPKQSKIQVNKKSKPEMVPNPLAASAKKTKPENQSSSKKAEKKIPQLVPNPLAFMKNKPGTSAGTGKNLFTTSISPIVDADTEIHDKIQIESHIPNLATILTNAPVVDSPLQGKSLFEWLIHPIPVTTFFSKYWEKQPLLIHRPEELRAYYRWLLSSATLDSVLRNNVIKFGKNLDITLYTNGERETHTPEGRAMPAVVWDYYSTGCSVRFLNPQTYVKPLWRLNASLQEYLGTFVGANVYLTPPDSQGFAPHYDDIEAFVLQIEGKKHWKVYKPRTPEEELPLYSSDNFKEEEIGKPILDVILEEGDLLYFPRGTIHQAKAVEGEHSLHITLSAYQLNSYADFLKLHLPIALEQAISESVDFRRGLPTDFLSYMGVVHSDSTDRTIKQKRKEFERKIKKLCEVVVNNPCDLAADQLGKKFIWDSLPPFLTKKEKPLTVHGAGEFMIEGQVFNRTEIDPDTEVKLLRKNCVRLVLEENTLRLYYNADNTLEYHEEDPQFLEVPSEAGPAIEYLITMYPGFSKIEDFPIDDETLKLRIAGDMYEKGILMTRNPLVPVDGNEMMFDSDEFEDQEDEEDEDSEDDDDDSEDDEDMYQDIEGDYDYDENETLELSNLDEDEDNEEEHNDEVDDDEYDSDLDPYLYVPGTDPEVDAILANSTNFLEQVDDEDEDDDEDYNAVNGSSYIEEINSDDEDEDDEGEEEEDLDDLDEDEEDSSSEEEAPPKLRKTFKN